MTDRPIAAILAVVAAAMFLATFSAAAVLRPDSAAVADVDDTPASPASATEQMDLATIAAPSLSRVAPLPALHLPKAKPKPHKKKPKAAKSQPAPRSTYTPPPTPTAAPTAAPPTYTPPVRNTAPPKRKSPSGQTFDTSG
jgi:hypothetical protein